MPTIGYLIAVFFLCLAAPMPTKASTERYYVPPQQFSAAFQVMDMGFANVIGLFQSATGMFSYDEPSQTISRMKLAIDVNSMMTGNQEIRRDLARLFEGNRYPEITFLAASDSTFKDGKAEIKGTLFIHGVEKPFTFEATRNQAGNSPHGGGMWNREGPALGLSMRGTFKRADFAMGDPAELPGRFGETITLMLEMQAIKQ